jgi:hypothetical protein
MDWQNLIWVPYILIIFLSNNSEFNRPNSSLSWGGAVKIHEVQFEKSSNSLGKNTLQEYKAYNTFQ